MCIIFKIAYRIKEDEGKTVKLFLIRLPYKCCFLWDGNISRFNVDKHNQFEQHDQHRRAITEQGKKYIFRIKPQSAEKPTN